MAEYIHLRPITESGRHWAEIEKRILAAFKKLLYGPIMREISFRDGKMLNAKPDLLAAIRRGTISYDEKTRTFSGRFSSITAKEIRKLGGTWDSRTSTYRIPAYGLPTDVTEAINLSQTKFQQKLSDITGKLTDQLPAKISELIDVSELFDSSIFEVDRQIRKTLRKITVSPTLDDQARKRIADEWSQNLKLWVKNFADEEVLRLRQTVEKHVFTGNRYDRLRKEIQKSFGVTENKAKFLARQETSLLMAKLKETRYEAAGVTEYKWACVVGSPLHPVRPSHKILEGKIFSWSNPPITTAPGEPARRNNPGQDYNCRCFAIPVVKFGKPSPA
jgi:SPP1 gp7 family putative phage head morphogenesis protein